MGSNGYIKHFFYISHKMDANMREHFSLGYFAIAAKKLITLKSDEKLMVRSQIIYKFVFFPISDCSHKVDTLKIHVEKHSFLL